MMNMNVMNMNVMNMNIRYEQCYDINQINMIDVCHNV